MNLYLSFCDYRNDSRSRATSSDSRGACGGDRQLARLGHQERARLGVGHVYCAHLSPGPDGGKGCTGHSAKPAEAAACPGAESQEMLWKSKLNVWKSASAT